MKYSLLLTFAAATLAHGNPFGEGDYFVGGSLLWVDNDTNDVIGGSARAGFNWQNDNEYGINTDLELEFGYYNPDNTFESGSNEVVGGQEILPILANVRVHVPLVDMFGFYAGGGWGFAIVETDFHTEEFGRIQDTNQQIIWTAFIGLELDFGRATVFGGYRYQEIPSDDVNRGTTVFRTGDDKYNILEFGANIHF